MKVHPQLHVKWVGVYRYLLSYADLKLRYFAKLTVISERLVRLKEANMGRFMSFV